jgi:hypothetical protein
MYIGVGLIATIVYRSLLKAENARRDRGERNEIIDGDNEKLLGRNEKNGRYASVEEAKRDKGDQWSGYRYIV